MVFDSASRQLQPAGDFVACHEPETLHPVGGSSLRRQPSYDVTLKRCDIFRYREAIGRFGFPRRHIIIHVVVTLLPYLMATQIVTYQVPGDFIHEELYCRFIYKHPVIENPQEHRSEERRVGRV